MTVQRRLLPYYAATLLCLTGTSDLGAQAFFQELVPAGIQNDTLGNGVAVRGDLLVSGNQTQFNGIHIWRLGSGPSPWSLEARIALNALSFAPPQTDITVGNPPSPAGGVRQVAVGVGRFVIGQSLSGSSAEKVQVYAYDEDALPAVSINGWILEQVLEPAFPDDPVHFGSSVQIAEGWIAVGSLTEGVWMFEHSGGVWTQQQCIKPPSGAAGFAAAIHVDGNVMAVLNTSGPDAVYIYERSAGSWALVQSVPAPGGVLANTIALEGDHLAFGDLASKSVTVVARVGGDWSNSPTVSTVTPFDYDTGFPGSSAHGSLNIPASLAISGGVLAVGSTNNLGSSTGHFFLFEQVAGTWQQTQKIYGPAGPGSGNGFAGDVGFDAGWLVSGQPNSLNDGRVWAMDVSSRPEWLDLGFGLAGVSGIPTLKGYGNLHGPMIDPTTADYFRVVLSNAAPSAAAVLWVSPVNISQPFKGGVLVPSPDDFALLNLTTDASGSISLVQEWLEGTSLAGVPFYWQFWVADSAAPAGASASNALRATPPSP